MRDIQPADFDAMILVSKGPLHRGEDEAGYEFYSTQPTAMIEPSVWGETPDEVIHNLQAAFAKTEKLHPSEMDWGI